MPVSEKDSHEAKIAELEKPVQEIEQQRVVLGDVVAEPAIARLQAQITALKAQSGSASSHRGQEHQRSMRRWVSLDGRPRGVGGTPGGGGTPSSSQSVTDPR